MTWVQAHPPGNTSVSQTRPQFQDNNAYIENTLQADHYFDDAAPANDGHHKFVHMPVQGADPALALTSCLYAKNGASASAVPFFRNSLSVFKIPLAISAGNIPVINGVTMLYNFVGLPAMTGTVYAYNIAVPQRSLFSAFMWNGVNFYVTYSNHNLGQMTGNGNLVEFGSVGMDLRLTTTAAMTVNLTIMCVLT